MEKEKKSKKKDKTTLVLPKAWQSVKHRNETAQARSNYEGAGTAIVVILSTLLFLFVILGGVSQTGVLKFIFNWSSNVGESVSNWIEGGSVITNEDGIYLDPTGKSGDPVKDENAPEVLNPIEDNSGGTDTNEETQADESKNSGNGEVNTE